MARGKKLDEKTIYRIMSIIYETGNMSEACRELNLGISTISGIYERNKGKEEFKELEKKIKSNFAETATRLINKATQRLEKQLDDDKCIIPANVLTTVIGTLYDKRALANGEIPNKETPTINIVVTDNTELEKEMYNDTNKG